MTRRIPLLGRGRSNGTTTTRRASPSPARRPVGVHYYKKSAFDSSNSGDSSSTALLAEHERIAGLIHPSAPPPEDMSASGATAGHYFFSDANFGGASGAVSGRRGGGQASDASSTGFSTGSNWDGDLNEYMAPMSGVGGVVLTDAFDAGSEALSTDEVDVIIDAVVDDIYTRNGVTAPGRASNQSSPKGNAKQELSKFGNSERGASAFSVTTFSADGGSNGLPPIVTENNSTKKSGGEPSPKNMKKSNSQPSPTTKNNIKKGGGQPSPSSVRDLTSSPLPPTTPKTNKKTVSNANTNATTVANRPASTSNRPPRSSKSLSSPNMSSQSQPRKTAITVVARTPSPTPAATAAPPTAVTPTATATSNDNENKTQSDNNDSFSSTKSAPSPLPPPQRTNSEPTEQTNDLSSLLPNWLRLVRSNDDTETETSQSKPPTPPSPSGKKDDPPAGKDDTSAKKNDTPAKRDEKIPKKDDLPGKKDEVAIKETIVMTPTPVANQDKTTNGEPKAPAARTSAQSLASSTSSLGSPTAWMDAVADNCPVSPVPAATPTKALQSGNKDTEKKEDKEVEAAVARGIRFSMGDDTPTQERPQTPATSTTSGTDQSVAASAVSSATSTALSGATSTVISRGAFSLDTSGGSTRIMTNVRPTAPATQSAPTLQSTPEVKRRPSTGASTPVKANSTGGLAGTVAAAPDKKIPTTADKTPTKDPLSPPGAPVKRSRSKSRSRSGGGGVTLNPKSNKPRIFYSKSPSRKPQPPPIKEPKKKPKLVRDFDLGQSVGLLSLVLPVPKTIPDDVGETGAETVSTMATDNAGAIVQASGRKDLAPSDLEATISRVPRSPCSVGSDQIALSEVMTDLAVRNSQAGSGEVVVGRRLLVRGTAKDRLEETIRCTKGQSTTTPASSPDRSSEDPTSPASSPRGGPVDIDGFIGRGKSSPVDVDGVSVSTFLSDPEKAKPSQANEVLGPIDVDKVGIFGWKKRSQQQQKQLQKQQAQVKKEKVTSDESLTTSEEPTLSPSETARTANQYIKENRFSEAAELYRSFLRSHRKENGPNNHLVASTLHNLAVVMVWSADYGKALSYCKEALKIRRGLNGVGHVDVSASLSELGIIYFAREEFNLALLAFREALQISCKSLGYEDPQIARILNNIGCVHFETGKLIAALATFEESLDIQRSSMGSSSDADNTLLNVSCVLCNMAMVSVKRRQLETAVSLMEEGLMVQESVLGDDHPKVVHTTENLAQLETLRQVPLPANAKKADQLHIVDLLGRGSTAFGASVSPAKSSPPKPIEKGNSSRRGSPERRSLQQPLEGGVSRKIPFGRVGSVSMFGNSDGIPKRRQSFGYSVDALAFDGIDVLDLGPIKKPISITQRVRESVLATFNTIQSCKSKSRSRRKPNDDNDEMTVYSTGSVFSVSTVPLDSDDRQSLSMPVDVDEENVMDAELHLKPIYEQAEEHLAHKEYDEAIELFEGVLRNHKEKYGEIHHLVGSAFHNLGIVQLHAEDYTNALASFQEAVNVRTASLGTDHPDVAASHVKCGIVLLAKEDLDGALFTFGQVLRSRRKALGYNHPQIAKLLNNIGCVHHEFGGTLAAMKSFEEALEMQRTERTHLVQSLDGGEASSSAPRSGSLALHDLDIAITLTNMGFIRFKRGEFAEAMVIYEEALKIQRDWLGYTDETVQKTLESLAFAMASARAQKNRQITGTLEKLTEMYVDMLGCRVGKNNCSALVES